MSRHRSSLGNKLTSSVASVLWNERVLPRMSLATLGFIRRRVGIDTVGGPHAVAQNLDLVYRMEQSVTHCIENKLIFGKFVI